MLGLKQLFRGYLVKDWFGADHDQNKYNGANQAIVKEYVKLYTKCWKQRNDAVQEGKKKKD